MVHICNSDSSQKFSMVQREKGVFWHSNPPDPIWSLQIWCVASCYPYFYQVLQIYHKILMTKEICYLFCGSPLNAFIPYGQKVYNYSWSFKVAIVKVVKEFSLLILKRWINYSKEKLQDICDKNENLLEYHKMMSKCRKCHLRETKFEKFPGEGMPQNPLEAGTFSTKIYSLIPLKRGWSVQVLQFN